MAVNNRNEGAEYTELSVLDRIRIHLLGEDSDGQDFHLTENRRFLIYNNKSKSAFNLYQHQIQIEVISIFDLHQHQT